MSTVTVAPTVDPTNIPPRIRLDVTDAGSPNLFATTVYRIDPDGVQRPVRTGDGTPLVLTTSGANRTGLIYDYEVPFGSPVSYTTAESPGSVSAEVTLDVTQTWLIHPGIPSLSLPITIGEISDRTRKATRGVFSPMNRRFPVVQTDGQRKAAEYTLKVYSPTLDVRQQIEELLDDAGVLLLNVPAGKGWGIGAEYIAAGDSTEARAITLLYEPTRFFSLPVTVVDRPVGGTQAERILNDLSVYPTLADLQAAYATLNAADAGP